MRMRFSNALLLIVSFALRAGCGGGGGGDAAAPVGLTYAGLTSQATVTDANAQALTAEAYEGGNSGTAIELFAGVASEGERPIRHSRLFRFASTLKEAMLQMDVTSVAGDPVANAVQQASETIQGDPNRCTEGPGSATFTMNYDDVTGAFTGTMAFNGLCGAGDTISGAARFSGQVNPVSGEMLHFGFSFDNLTLSSDVDSITIAGTLSMDGQSIPAVATMDILLKDNVTTEVYWVNNYTLQITEGPGYKEIEASGRFYHPGHGYVIVSTLEPLVVYDADGSPSSGVLLVEGTIGPSGSFTAAMLTALSSTRYLVEADTDGDGLFDDYSREFLWP
ncbi:MAG: hypothetical protein ACM34H_02185 [Deltaproteobacteria bacterium]